MLKIPFRRILDILITKMPEALPALSSIRINGTNFKIAIGNSFIIERHK